MPDIEFIHSTADVTRALCYALDSGFHVLTGIPQKSPRALAIHRGTINDQLRGVFYLVRPAWEFGPYQMMEILEGNNKGMYTLSPRVNFAPITVFFQGERADQGKRQLGNAVLSFHRDWLEQPEKKIRKSPRDLELWFRKLAGHLLSKVVLRAGVHRYHISATVLADPTAAQCLPPFDFIPWNKEIFVPPK